MSVLCWKNPLLLTYWLLTWLTVNVLFVKCRDHEVYDLYAVKRARDENWEKNKMKINQVQSSWKTRADFLFGMKHRKKRTKEEYRGDEGALNLLAQDVKPSEKNKPLWSGSELHKVKNVMKLMKNRTIESGDKEEGTRVSRWTKRPWKTVAVLGDKEAGHNDDGDDDDDDNEGEGEGDIRKVPDTREYAGALGGSIHSVVVPHKEELHKSGGFLMKFRGNSNSV
mmetsp:Transcript_22973/g.31936  ORF Transcript_22973/g.31936 Transcript_22973/m.31936 type:complete len:224 (+) Transcript_22973:80-751(+)